MTRTRGKAARLADLTERLRLRPHGVAELAERYGTTRRTIERDLQDLREMGHGLLEEDHRYALPDNGSALNEIEALAVYSATRLLVHTGVGERHYRRALEKLARQLPDPARTSLIAAVDRLEPAPEDRTLDLVAQAWFQSRVLHCTYHGARSGSRNRVELETWFYELNRRNLEPYVLAYDRAHAKEVRIYKLSRMHDVRLGADRYEIPDDFDPHTHLEGTWGIVIGDPVRVRIRVDASVAFWFHEHRSDEPTFEVVATEANGDLVVDVMGQRAAGGDVHELLSFLLGWGERIEVLDPPDIRERVAEELHRAASVYART